MVVGCCWLLLLLFFLYLDSKNKHAHLVNYLMSFSTSLSKVITRFFEILFSFCMKMHDHAHAHTFIYDAHCTYSQLHTYPYPPMHFQVSFFFFAKMKRIGLVCQMVLAPSDRVTANPVRERESVYILAYMFVSYIKT